MNLSSMQVEAIKKRNMVLISYREKITLLEKDANSTKQLLERLKVKLQEKEN